MNLQTLLQKRKATKAKKVYVRSDGRKRLRIARTGWRRPKGHHAKIRLNLRGYDKQVEVGYASPKAVRGLHVSGLLPVTVLSHKDFEGLDSKTHCVIIGAVGMRKKVLLVAEAQKRKLLMTNVKHPETVAQDVQKKVQERKEQQKQKRAAKTKKKQEKTLEKKVEKSEKKEEEKDQKQLEKEEKDKVLTQKE